MVSWLSRLLAVIVSWFVVADDDSCRISGAGGEGFVCRAVADDVSEVVRVAQEVASFRNGPAGEALISLQLWAEVHPAAAQGEIEVSLVFERGQAAFQGRLNVLDVGLIVDRPVREVIHELPHCFTRCFMLIHVRVLVEDGLLLVLDGFLREYDLFEPVFAGVVDVVVPLVEARVRDDPVLLSFYVHSVGGECFLYDFLYFTFVLHVVFPQMV